MSTRQVNRYRADPEVAEMAEERREQMAAAAGVKREEVIGTLVSHMRGDVTDAFEWGISGVTDRLKANRLGYLVKSVSFSEKTGRLTRLEFNPSQPAAIQLCKVLGIEQEAGKNKNDTEMLNKLLDERIGFAIKGFKRGGVDLTKRDVLEMFAKTPESAGELYPLIQARLAGSEAIE